MSIIKKRQHAAGLYDDDWRAKLSTTSTNLWKDESKKASMAKKVSKAKRKVQVPSIR